MSRRKTLYDDWSCCTVSLVMWAMSKCREEDNEERMNLWNVTRVTVALKCRKQGEGLFQTWHKHDQAPPWHVRQVKGDFFRALSHTRRALRDTCCGCLKSFHARCRLAPFECDETPLVGVFSCLARPTPAEHDKTPILGIFYAWRHPALVEYDGTPPRGRLFMLSATPHPSSMTRHPLWVSHHAGHHPAPSMGVFSCSSPFPTLLIVVFNHI